ncbi:MAG: MG2 domain-containing protein, partial [Planctomycetota bacterium]
MDSQTRQRLLELVYDLLPDPEAAELRRQIDADEEVARAYAEAQDTANLLAQAARLSAPKVELKLPEQLMSTPTDSSPPQAAVRASWPARTSRARGASWAMLAAAVLLLLLPSAGSYWWHKEELDRIAGKHLRLMVTGPAILPVGVDARYTVNTTAITGAPMPAEVELALYCPDGKRLHDQKGKSDRDGRLEVTIPAEVDVPSGAKMKVVATSGKNQEPVETRLAVEPVRYVTHLALDKPLYQPGETVYYRSLSLSRFGLAADRQMPIHFEILDPSGAVVPGSQLQGVTEHGVGSGAFGIPEQSAGGEYVLVARGLDQAFPEEKRPFFIRSYRLPRLKKELEFTRDSYGPGDPVVADFLALRGDGAAAAGAKLRIIATVDGQQVFTQPTQADDAGAFQVKFDLPDEIQRGEGQLAVVVDDGGNRETIAKTLPINLGKVEVDFYPEGGDLVVGLESRVYFAGRNPLGEPVHVEGKIVDGSGRKVASVETTHEGMGSFSLRPRANRKYRLKITSPADVSEEPELPEASTRQQVVLSTGSGVFAAGEPLEFNVRASRAGLPLVVAAYCRGVPVGQQALVTVVDKDNANVANSVAIPVAGEVGGVIRLTVYDYSTDTPQPVAERLVYRRMRRGLKVRTAGVGEGYSPGGQVKMSLIVTNERDEPVPAVLGVAVVDDKLLSLADDDTPAMKTHFLLTTEVEKPEDLEDADFYLSDDAEAEVALDLLLGTQGWRRFVEKSLGELRKEGGDKEGGGEEGD